MATISIDDFKIGLDRRRLPDTSLAGSLVVCENAHITRGGEIEKSEAFIRVANLPANTYGLKAIGNEFYVFGSDNITPTIINTNPPIKYQRLNDGSASMKEVFRVDAYDGSPYVIADYTDGIIRHFFDGSKVTDVVSGKAKAQFTISGTSAASGVAAIGSFRIISPQNGASITAITVGSTALLGEAVTYNTASDLSVDEYVQRVVDAINQYGYVSGFTASKEDSQKINLTYQIPGASVNADSVSVTATGTISIQEETAMAGGVAPKQITAVEVDSVDIMPTDVDWAESNIATAEAVASSINDYTGTSGYEAFAFGSTVIIQSTTAGTGPNGDVLAVTAESPISITNASATVSGGGSAAQVEPGRFCKTYGTKMYLLTGASIYYSAVGDATDYGGGSGTGDGFDNLSTNTGGSETLISVANYFSNMAIFSQNTVQIWNMAADPAENAQIQVLNNTGTFAQNSVVEFGDNDVFYLSEYGVRSLRARNTTNAAFVNDVGIAIDSMIKNDILEDSLAAERAVGFIEPREGRYWLAIGDTIYVFSFFPSGKISSWSTYKPGFVVDAITSVGQTILLRSGDVVYKFGSTAERKYSARETKIITPFFFGDNPAKIKTFTGLDVLCRGTWEIWVSTSTDAVSDLGVPDEDFYYHATTINGSTTADSGGFNGHIGLEEVGTHISFMFKNKRAEYGKIGKLLIHLGDDGELM